MTKEIEERIERLESDMKITTKYVGVIGNMVEQHQKTIDAIIKTLKYATELWEKLTAQD